MVTSHAGTGAAFGIYGIAVSFGPTSVIDSIRTTLWHQSKINENHTQQHAKTANKHFGGQYEGYFRSL
jgi:hypothetical protein